MFELIIAAFCATSVLANIISVKMVPIFNFCVPMGLLIYPLTFFLSDLMTEWYGVAKARRMVYAALAANLLSFALIQIALLLPTTNSDEGAFVQVMGLSGLRIVSSLIAYLTAQLADVQLYTWIKKWTKSRFLWLRSNGSTCTSQLIDTIVIDLLFLHWGLGMPFADVWPIMVFSYCFKAFFSLASTPFFYLCVNLRPKEAYHGV